MQLLTLHTFHTRPSIKLNKCFLVLRGKTRHIERLLLGLILTQIFMLNIALANETKALPELIKEIKPSVVAIGLFTPIESDAPRVLGSGFAIANGRYIATNYRLVSAQLNPELVQYFVVLSGEGKQAKVHRAKQVAIDPTHDIAILSIEDNIRPLGLASDDYIDAGISIATTAYPIGAVLGLYPATHTGIIAALTPAASPQNKASSLSSEMLDTLQNPYLSYQLDITSFPGNIGGAIYRKDTGQVVGILNRLIVSQAQDGATISTSGISYAIPVKHLRELAKKHNIQL